jgi:RNA polymerase sigma factor (sigma-70 family)
LVDAVRRGDDRAFELLYSRYRARIGAYIQGMIGDPGRAEDIAQEVFISALRRLRATEQPILLKPWLYEIAKNACIDEFRRARRAQEVPLESEGGLDQIGTLHAINVTPDAAIETKQRLNDLRGAFHGLSDHHHQILVLRELEGLSYNQIGVRMGISKPVVESTLFRARRRLGEEFAELESGRRCARVQGMIAAVASGSCPERSLGLRQRRLLGRHLLHCDQCVRDARMAGIDDIQLRGLRKAAKAGGVAAVALPWLRLRSAPASDPAGPGGTHAASTAQLAQSALPAVNSIDQLSGLGRAATAAILAIAGAGGGIVASRSVISSASPTPIVWTLGAVHGFHGVGALGGSGVVRLPVASNLPGAAGTRGGAPANGASAAGARLARGVGASGLGNAAVTLAAPGSAGASPSTVGSAAGPVDNRPANLAGALLAGGGGHVTAGGLPVGGIGAAATTAPINSPVSSVPRAGAAPTITIPHVGANLPITHSSPGTISIGPINIGIPTAGAGGGIGVGATGPVVPRIPGAPAGVHQDSGGSSGSGSASSSGTPAAPQKAGATVKGAVGAATGAATGAAAQAGTAVGAATGAAAQAGTAVGAATGAAAQAGTDASSATTAAMAAGAHAVSNALGTGTKLGG